MNIFFTQNLTVSQHQIQCAMTDATACTLVTVESYRNCADSIVVVFLSIRTCLMFAARRAWMRALSCFFGDRSWTYLLLCLLLIDPESRPGHPYRFIKSSNSCTLGKPSKGGSTGSESIVSRFGESWHSVLSMRPSSRRWASRWGTTW